MKNKSEGSNVKTPSRQGVLGRREFLQTTVLGAVAAAAAGQSSGGKDRKTCDILLLTCIDFRLIHYVGKEMVRRGHAGNYDQVILAGASLGANNKVMPGWGQTFWDHVGLAKDLHKIKKVIVMDHRYCGAYEKTLGQDVYTPARHKELHSVQLRELRKEIKDKHPGLVVELLLMDLQGNTQTIS